MELKIFLEPVAELLASKLSGSMKPADLTTSNSSFTDINGSRTLFELIRWGGGNVKFVKCKFFG